MDHTTSSASKSWDLDKICRVCLVQKKEMRPIFGELVADMLMDVARVAIENTDGWPDKICIQCVHQVSRCHAFKMRVEKSDEELRNYIKSLTVIVEEPVIEITPHPSSSTTTQIINPSSHNILNNISRQTTLKNATTINHHQHHHHQQQQQHHHQHQHQQLHHQQHQQHHQQHQHPHHHHHINTNNRHNIQTATAIQQSSHQHQPQQHQVVLSNGQLHSAQIINGQLVTHSGTPITQIVNANQLGTLIQTSGGNGSTATVQMLQQNGQPTQIVQIQQTVNDDHCEIIVEPDDDDDEAHYYEDVTDQLLEDSNDIDNNNDDIIHIQEDCELEEMDEDDTTHLSTEHLTFELIHSDDDIIESSAPDEEEEEEIEEIEEEDHEDHEDHEEEAEEYEEEDENMDDKEYITEFINSQTTCLGPGRFICNLCRKEFKQNKWLQNHMKSHSNWIKANCKKQPQCEICHKSFKGPGMLRMHMKTHEHILKVPTCSICKKQFKSKTILYRHRQTHQQKLYQCGNCMKNFSSACTLNSHLTKKHENDQYKYQCAQCSDLFESLDDLKTHITNMVCKTEDSC